VFGVKFLEFISVCYFDVERSMGVRVANGGECREWERDIDRKVVKIGLGEHAICM